MDGARGKNEKDVPQKHMEDKIGDNGSQGRGKRRAGWVQGGFSWASYSRLVELGWRGGG